MSNSFGEPKWQGNWFEHLYGFSVRVLLASVVSSLAIVPLYLLLLVFSGDLAGRLLAPLLLLALAVSIAAICCVALPLHLVLVRIGRPRGYYYLAVGFFVPAIVTLALNPFGTDIASWVKWQAMAMGLLGGLIALIFWRIAMGGSSNK